jgi:FkbM family methyltransferase
MTIMNLLKEQAGFKPQFILDVGANEGNWNVMIKGVYPQANVFSVEANDENVRHLQDKRLNYTITMLGKEKKNQVPFYMSKKKGGTGNSMFIENSDTFDKDGYKLLNLNTLDNVLEEQGLPCPDYLKLDVQGAEIEVLKGYPKHFACTSVVLAEANILKYNQGAPLASQLITFMSQNGFELFDIAEEHRLNTKVLIQVDFIFINVNSPIWQRLHNVLNLVKYPWENSKM